MFFIFLWFLSFTQVFFLAFGIIETEESCLRATLSDSSSSYMCDGLDSFTKLFDLIKSDAYEIQIRNSNLTDDGVDYINFPLLRTLTITKSFLSSHTLSWMYSLKNLNVLRIVECTTHNVTNFQDNPTPSLELKMAPLMHLEHLFIKKCNISNLDHSNVSDFDSLHLSLTDNMFECNHGDFIWLLNLYNTRASVPSKSINMDNAKCYVEKEFNKKDVFYAIYTIADESFHTIMDYRKEVFYKCPPKCQCEFTGIVRSDPLSLSPVTIRPMINIKCMGLNLTSLPSVIPNGSSRCNFSNNSIEDLSPYFKYKGYESVNYMGLSHNRIKYFDANLLLEFFRKKEPEFDVVFNLRHNQLSKFPAAEIMNLKTKPSEESRRLPAFYLGNNPFICSCDYIGSFRTMIYRHMQYVEDVTDIKCSDEDPSNPGVVIFTLDIDSLCPSETFFYLLDVVNIILSILLISLIANFGYNAWQYRKNRKLPWIVRKCYP